MDNVRIYDSEAVNAGHGFLCERCSFVAVQNSRFENLTSRTNAGAIMIKSLYNEKDAEISYLFNNDFINCTAPIGGGAIYLDRPSYL